jgi:hypothetical protein
VGMLRLDRAAFERVVAFACEYGLAERLPLADMGASVLAAACAILSSGMNDEQLRAVIEQAFEFTAPARRHTEERWKRTGFDPYAGEKNQS